MPATEYGDRAITELLRESNTALHDSLRTGLDVEGTLLRVRSRALVREIAATARPAEEFPTHWRRHDEPVADAIAGNDAATARLLATIRPLVVRYCRARVGRNERSFASADDVAQEVCLAVLTALPSYRDQGRPFLAFVYGIAQHKVADAHRAAARNRTDPVPEIPDGVSDAVGPEQRALRFELNERLARLLDVLPAKQREIVVLRIVVGLSAEETAGAVGSTPGAVRVAQHRALARLRRLLTGEDE
jgi:RNA polymerase sigma-70 factor (ECF subfamily)